VRLSFLDHLSKYLAVMGIPGLLVISFLDSAAVPMAGGPDAVIILLSCANPVMALWIALAATIGSTFGNLILYGIGFKGGEKALTRFNPERVARMEQRMRKHGIWAIVVSVIAPPPFPTKLVILAAGVLHIGKVRFTVAVFIGRFARYFLLALLAARYGNHAMQIIKEHYPTIALALIALILLFLLVRKIRSRRKSGAD
jgi:membrane protein YqaA with SNARE-associated domain